jgi:hypothetical protein
MLACQCEDGCSIPPSSTFFLGTKFRHSFVICHSRQTFSRPLRSSRSSRLMMLPNSALRAQRSALDLGPRFASVNVSCGRLNSGGLGKPTATTSRRAASDPFCHSIVGHSFVISLSRDCGDALVICHSRHTPPLPLGEGWGEGPAAPPSLPSLPYVQVRSLSGSSVLNPVRQLLEAAS